MGEGWTILERVSENQNEAREPVMWTDIWGEYCTSKGKDFDRNILGDSTNNKEENMANTE